MCVTLAQCRQDLALNDPAENRRVCECMALFNDVSLQIYTGKKCKTTNRSDNDRVK